MQSPSVLQLWLDRLCGTIPGAICAVLVRAEHPGEEQVAAAWPRPGVDADELVAAATAAGREQRPVVARKEAEGPAPSRLAIPLQGGAGQACAVAMDVVAAPGWDTRRLLDRLQASGPWFELLTRGDQQQERLVTVLDLAAIGLEQDSLKAAATALATELATRLRFERVAIGLAERGGIEVEALSGTATFDGRSNLVSALAAAMDEAADQQATVTCPELPDEAPRITRAHEQLAGAHGTGPLCTVPLASGERIIGAILFERAPGGSVDLDAVHLCEDAGALLGPLLALRLAAEAGPLTRLRLWLRARAEQLFGPSDPEITLAAVAGAALLLAAVLWHGDYRITADATLEGSVQRAIVAGVDGYVGEANARAGDLVERGQVLGRLDDRDLRLERRKWAGRRAQVHNEYREALAAHDRASLNIVSARLSQADAQLELLEEQLLRTQLVAPFDGVIVRGDLSQALGSPVERGAVLFEVAPLDGYRIILEIDERDMRVLQPGRKGHLVLTALPGRSLPLTVERVTPVSVAREGSNYFRAEARLDVPTDSLRPGMRGVAKIEIDRRPLFWIWTHGLVGRARLLLWSWLP